MILQSVELLAGVNFVFDGALFLRVLLKAMSAFLLLIKFPLSKDGPIFDRLF